MAPQIDVQEPKAHPDAPLLKAFSDTPQLISNKLRIDSDPHLQRPSEAKRGITTQHVTNPHQLPASGPYHHIPSLPAKHSSKQPASIESFSTNSEMKHPDAPNPPIASPKSNIPNVHSPTEVVGRPLTELKTVSTPKRIQERETITGKGNILERLGKVEWMPILEGTIEEVESFANVDNAETRFQEFKSFVLQQGKALELPHGCKPYDRVLLRPNGPGTNPSPCIRFTGFRSREQVKKYHAVLSRNPLRKVYSPPLRLCYEICRLRFLAGPSQTLSIGSPVKGSLCGSLAVLIDDENTRKVTVGGLLKTGSEYSIITAGHRVPDHDDTSVDEDSSVSSFESSLDLDDYDDDVLSPLILGDPADDLPVNGPEDVSRLYTAAQSLTIVQETSKQPTESPLSPQAVAQLSNATQTFAPPDAVKLSGEDWSLASISNPALSLPNCFYLEDSTRPIYLTRTIDKPCPDQVWLLAGVTGQKSVTMARSETQLSLPSGNWVTVWKVRFEDDICE